nr:hypothetical protein [Bacilli bacterium]
MNRKVRNWMIASVAVVLAELGGFVEGRWHSMILAIVCYSLAGLGFFIALIRVLIERYKK